MNATIGTTYLLHFETKFGHAQHYVGWTENVVRRLIAHRSGKGGRLCAAVAAAGIGINLAQIWPGTDRHFERKLHNRNGSGRFCPICAALKKAGSK